jgi:maleylpyruvate isomerase
MKFKLYHYWRSSSSWRVRWVMALKDLPCEFLPINLLSDEPDTEAHLSRNPLGFVPVLEILDPNGSRPSQFLAESIAIIEYFEEIYPHHSVFAGDAFLRARTRQLAELVNAGIQPIQNLNVMQMHSSDPEEQKRWTRHWIRVGLQAYETLVKETCGQYSVGNTLTLADIFLIPQCYNAIRYDVPLSEFPTIEKIHQIASITESCQKSAPDRFQPK